MTPTERLQLGALELAGLGRMLRHVAKLTPRSRWNAARLIAELGQRAPTSIGLVFEDRRYTWREIDAHASRWAAFLGAEGVRRGDVVALVMDNRPEFLFALAGLNRLGAVAALVNHHSVGKPLAHAIRVAQPRGIVVGSEHLSALLDVLPDLTDIAGPSQVWVQSDAGDGPAADSAPADGPYRCIDAALAAAPPLALGRVPLPSGADPMCLIYTSGTTGLPKAALITNQRWLVAAALFGGTICAATPRDVIYMTLPLYHSTGMFAGWGASLISGATLALRRRFSASQCWSDVRRVRATIFVYIGELCRYLLAQPEHPDERAHQLRLCTGNGLRPDIWVRFQQRFGVPLVREFYGATEGNAPLVNLAGKPGMIGRLRPGQLVVRCSPSSGAVTRDGHGLCQAALAGESGLLIGKITRVMRFDGYVDREATEAKILHDVRTIGDRWFNSGDLVRVDADGWVAFADRVGDTFRWKGENVSTNEVAEQLNGCPGVLESNVYGVVVPGADGRAGMASLRVAEAFDLDRLAAHVAATLADYQRPHFIRLQRDMRITATFKHQKVDYRDEGFDPERVSDALYLLESDRYVALTPELYLRICAGEAGPARRLPRPAGARDAA